MSADTNVAPKAPPDAATRRAQALVGAGALLAAALLAWGATSISSDAGYAGIGPNFLPWLVAALLGLCGVLLLREALGTGFRELGPTDGAESGDWHAFAWVSAGILLNAALLTTLGFILSCALCFVLAVRGFRVSEGAARLSAAALLKDLAIGIAISAPVYWMFSKGLAISLPGLTDTGWL